VDNEAGASGVVYFASANFGLTHAIGHRYAGRSGLIALLHRLGLEYHKPKVIPRKLTGAPYRAYLFSVGRRTQYWII
jgi:hypothetical protein